MHGYAADDAPRERVEQTATWQKHRYTVIKITDGDTFTATDGNIRFKVRIVGMDAPESKQAYGEVAKHTLSTVILNKTIAIQPVKSGLDMYGRVLGQVYVDQRDVAELMIAQGMATYYRPTCRDYPEDSSRYNYDPRVYVEAEAAARREKRGVWALPAFKLPCVFRMK